MQTVWGSAALPVVIEEGDSEQNYNLPLPWDENWYHALNQLV